MDPPPEPSGRASSDVGSDDGLFGQPQALPVADLAGAVSFDGPADTPEEYLARVRYEASHIPAVVRVEPSAAVLKKAAARQQAQLLPKGTDIPATLPELLPKPRWVQAFAAEFSGLREGLDTEALPASCRAVQPPPGQPALGDIEAWEAHVLGSDWDPSPTGDGNREDSPLYEAEASRGGGHLPTPACLLSMDQVTVSGLLEALLERCTGLADAPPHRLALWIFAMAARLEKPLTAGMEASMRALVRHAATLRAAMDSPADPRLPRVNLLAALAGGYFRQDETLSPFVTS
mmetsp:Transcript_28797/g.81115  ORF Transcript_28797/g.81115 Transcript_28797/m.81115 type:complete len:290 (-) Transcript_28797:757-1626(-)